MTEEKKPSIEETLSGIEDVIRKMDSGELPLSDALAAYEQGIRLIRRAEEMLGEAGKQLRILSEDGQNDAL